MSTQIQERDMPKGLDPSERLAYHKGYASGAQRFIKSHGVPSITGALPAKGTTARAAAIARLKSDTRTWLEEREPVAHKAGMAALARYRKKAGIEVPKAPARRRPALSSCPHCGGSLVGAA